MVEPDTENCWVYKAQPDKTADGLVPSQIVWGDVRGRGLTVAETETVMTGLVMNSSGFESIEALIEEAIARKLIEP